MCHETAPQPLLKLLRIATAAARLPLTAAATVQRSAVPHTATQQHSNTATQRHSNTAVQRQQRSDARSLLYRTLPLTEIKEQHTHRHPNTQRRSYTHHYTERLTCSSARTYHTAAARRCTPAHNHEQQRPAQPLPEAHITLAARCHRGCRLVRYSSATLRLRHPRSKHSCRTSAQHGLPAIAADAAATDNTRATPLPHCTGNATVTHACTHHTKTHKRKRAIASKNNRNTAVQHPTHCTRHKRRQCTPKTHITHRVYDAATILHIFAGQTHTSRIC